MTIRTRRIALVLPLTCLVTAAACHAAQWEPIASMPVAKGDGFGVLWNGKFFDVGGAPWQNGGDQDGSVYAVSLVLPNAAWSPTAPLNGTGPIVSQGGGIDGLNRLVFFGGIDPSNGDGGPTMLYDPINGATTSLPARPGSAAKQGFAFCTDELGRIYSIGGGNGAGTNASALCVRYSAATNSWSTIASLPAAVSQTCAASDGAGHLYVFGGFNANGSARTADVQRYDLASGTWSNTVVPDMPIALSHACAASGDDHRIYVMGGIDASGAVRNTTYVLDTWTNTWTAGPAMATAREHAAAVRGPDAHVYVVGGRGNGGVALATGERLATPPCPTILQEPVDMAGWEGLPVGFSVAAMGGDPLSYRWRRDGVDLVDGPMATGGVVSGATSTTLSIASASAADIGAYDVVVTTPCGVVTSDAVSFSLRPVPAIPTRWEVRFLHPAWADGSYLRDVEGDTQVGGAWAPFEIWSTIDRPVIWHGTAESAMNITPEGSAGGSIAAIDGDAVAGWWWWPYTCSSGGTLYTCYSMEAASWTGGAAEHHNLQVSGWEFSEVTSLGGAIKGGYVWTDDAGPDTYTFNAGVWLPPNDSFVNVQPANVWRSIIQASDGNRQFGWIFPNDSFTAHAAGWSASKDSCVDMNPAGVSRSLLYGAGDGQQVGVTGPATLQKAGLWGGNAGSYVSLHPSAFTTSFAAACSDGYQVGLANTATTQHALLWNGSAEGVFDLQSVLPASYQASAAYGIDVAPDGTVTVVGSAWSAANGRQEAVMWVSAASVAGDLNGDGHVDGSDLAILLGAWGSAGPLGDLNGDAAVDGSDLAMLLGAWG